jgi:hypothetical protein
LKPEGLREGQRQAMAGRFTPSIFRSRVIDISISAPVLPQDTATGASPARTASIADHMEVCLPWRSTEDGFSSIRATSSV